jgi:alkylation response protein AidB-like acyl-CoA dehydrogenase
MMDSGKATSG